MEIERRDLEKVFLRKWCPYVIEGERVTTEQAEEIILRTDPLWLSSNNKIAEAQFCELFGFKEPFDYKARHSMRKRLKSLDLEFLTTSRLLSCYVHGPGGWVDWNGTIRITGHNLGKWPSATDIFDECQTIAEAFPYLKFRLQVWSDEEAPDDARPPVIEFVVSEGKVIAKEPEGELPFIRPEISFDFINNPNHEVGIGVGALAEILERVLKRTGGWNGGI